MEKYYREEMHSLGSNQYINNAVLTGEYRYDLSIAVIAFNKLEYTKQCVESILKYVPKDLHYELILINHGSTDGTKEYFESISPTKQLDIFINGGGLAAYTYICEGKYFMLVSNDVIVTENAIANMIKCMESDEKIAWVVPATSK
jgi:GT2 family glycosyltransferase